jgi:thiol-disulfide isomerase/thioredoxin
MKQTLNERGSVQAVMLAIVGLLAVGIAGYYISRGDAEVMVEKSPEVMVEKSPDAMIKTSPEVMMEKSVAPSPSVMMKKDEGSMVAKAKVAEYTKAAYDAAVSSGDVVALYFYANWCPICKAGFPRFEAAVSTQNGDTFSAFRVSFNDSDTSSEEAAAAKTFQVGSQHTLVMVKNGAVLSKELVSSTTQSQYEAAFAAALK